MRAEGQPAGRRTWKGCQPLKTWISVVPWEKGQAATGGGPAIMQVSKAAADPLAQFCSPSSWPTKANPTSQDFPNKKLSFLHKTLRMLRREQERDLLSRHVNLRPCYRKKRPGGGRQSSWQSRFQVSKDQSWQTLIDPVLPMFYHTSTQL